MLIFYEHNLPIWACVRNVDVRPDRASWVTVVLPALKYLYPSINSSSNHDILTSVLIQYPTVNFSRFHSLWSQKSDAYALFNNGATLQRSVFVYLTLASIARLSGEHCAVRVRAQMISPRYVK